MLACLTLGACSLAVPAAPAYDPWSWLIWGREIAHLELSTAEGPAWKPLPALIGTVLVVVAGDLAPQLWLAIARAGALLAVLLAWRLGRRLSCGSLAGGVAAGLGVLACDSWIWHGAVGDSEGLLVALGLLAVDRGLDGRLERSFGWLAAAALLRVEAWPFLCCLGVVLWAVRPQRRPLVAGVGLLVPLMWFVPELLGSGEPLRSAGRARVPGPGAPALAEHPALEAVLRAVAIPLPSMALGAIALALLAARPGYSRPAAVRALLPAAAGAAWIACVALMSEAGFSGEERYLIPGAALVSVSGGAGIGLLARRLAGPSFGRAIATLALAALVAVTAHPLGQRLRALPGQADRLAHSAALASDLEAAVAAVGGKAAVRACARPYVGPYRGPLLAWRLRTHKAEIGFRPTGTGVIFRSRLRSGGPPAPDVPAAFERVVAAGEWQVWANCAGPPPVPFRRLQQAASRAIRLP